MVPLARVVSIGAMMLALGSSIACDRPVNDGSIGRVAFAPTAPSSFWPGAGFGNWDGYWTLNASLASVSGPAACTDSIHNLPIPPLYPLNVRVSDPTIVFVSTGRLDATNEFRLAGSIAGEDFNAIGTFPGVLPCGAFPFRSRLTGRFINGGYGMVGRETWTFDMPAGDPVVMSFNWNAQPR